MTLHKFTVKELGVFTVEALPEDMHPSEMECDIDDFVTAVERMVDKFGDWGWCIVKVTASWETFEGVTYLVGCSYESLADFEKSAYYTEMLQESVDDLNKNIEKQYDVIKRLVE